jgi:pimeloyl-ACP methyl ester carboxylesterase
MSVSALLSHTATIGGVRTRVLERPGDDALTLLLIHGWADSADTWKPLIAALDDLPARIVAFDLPSFGAAGDLQPGPQLPQFVATVAAALQQFAGRGRLLPVGQSLGGRALLMALHQADAASRAIPGCIVIGPAPLELPAWQKMLVRNGSLAPSASRLGEPLDAAQQRAEFLKSFKRTCLAEPDRVDASVYDDYLRHYTAERIGRHMESLRLIGGELQQPLSLDRVQMPVEIIWGEADRMAPVGGADRYCQALRDARLTRLPGCGHHAHLERIDDVATIVRRMAQPV